MKVVESKKISHRKARVTIEGKSPEEVSSMNAKHMAIEAGISLGLFRPGISMYGGPYMIKEGEDTAFRQEYEVQSFAM